MPTLAETAPSLETPQPTKTRTPTATSIPPLVLLIRSTEDSFSAIIELQTLLSELAAAEGMNFQVRTGISPEDLTQEVRIVVALPPDPGLASLAAAVEDVQFVGINISGLEPTPNLSAIGPQGATSVQQGFLAGCLAALVTSEWRVGVISASDTPRGLAERNGFLNGAVFFCGMCNPAHPPYHNYPLYVEMPSTATPSEWQRAAEIIAESFVETVYVSTQANGEELLSYLAQKGINIIGGIAPPAEVSSNWVATVQPDATNALQQIWQDLIAGNGGYSLPLMLKISHINGELFSQGRQRLAGIVLKDLQDGFIDTGIDPQTGLNR